MKKIILVADDNLDSLSKICGYLNDHGYFVLPAVSAQQAFGIAFHKKPELIMYDKLMAGFHVDTFCEILKLNPSTSDIPVICLSTEIENSNLENFHKNGIVDVLSKPGIEEILLAWLNRFFNIKPESNLIFSA